MTEKARPIRSPFGRRTALAVAALALLLAALAMPPAAALAQDATQAQASDAETSQTGRRVARVGCYDLRGFIDKNADGNYYGYAVDYLNALSAYTGWGFQITVSDNASLKQGLADGTFDFLMPCEYSDERLSQYSFTHYPMGEQFDGLYVLGSRSDVSYEDYAAFDGMRIGVVKDTSPATSLRANAKAHSFSYQEVEYASLSDLTAAFEAGEVDAVCRSGLGDIPDDYHLVASTELRPFYIVASATRTSDLFAQLVTATDKLNAEQPTLSGDLYDKYLRETDFSQEQNFTKEERAYIAAHPTISVASFSNRYPISYRDPATGQMAGILHDELELISQNTGLRFSYSTIDDDTPILGGLDEPGVDLVAGPIRTPDNRSDPSIRMSLGLHKNVTGIVGRKSEYFDVDKDYSVAIPDSSLGTMSHVREYHPGYSIVNYPSTEECLRAVMSGQVDAAMQNAEALAAILDHPEFGSLTLWYTFTGEGEYDYSVVSSASADPLLISIMDKGILSLDRSKTEAIDIRYTSATHYQVTFQDVMAQHGATIALVALLLAGVAAAIATSFRTKRRAMARLQEAVAESERANQAKTDLLSNVSHDMRTPLNAVLGYAELSHDVDDPCELHDYLAKIEQSGVVLQQLVDDTLDLSRITTGNIALAPAAIRVDGVIDDLVTTIRPSADGKGVHLACDLPEPPAPLVMADAPRLRQILLNLLSNAVKFTPAKGTVSLRVSRTPQEGRSVRYRFVVADTGCGMSEEFVPKAFEPFAQERTERNADVEGTGLGLSIVKMLVELMGGTISVASELGVGSTFVVCLDLPLADEPPKAEAEESPGKERPDLVGRRVLLVEDNRLNSEIARMLLEREGLVVDSAANGAEGVEAFEASGEGDYDLILMDMRMPVMGGLEATRAIRGLDRPDASTVLIVAMTANAYESDVRACLEAGMNAHTAKPIDRARLLDTIAQEIARRDGDGKDGDPHETR